MESSIGIQLYTGFQIVHELECGKCFLVEYDFLVRTNMKTFIFFPLRRQVPNAYQTGNDSGYSVDAGFRSYHCLEERSSICFDAGFRFHSDLGIDVQHFYRRRFPKLE